jgi:hypothetical protein
MTSSREQMHPKQSLMVERDGIVVTLTVTCLNMMDAMELFDNVCAQARDGMVLLDIETVQKA